MPPRRRVPAPIPIDVEGVRRKLAEGKIVRVGISKSAHFPDGATGRVRHVGDPAVDGEEYVQVELSLNGTRDILPFTPADLTPATRGRPAGSAGAGSGKPTRGVANGTAKPVRKTTLTVTAGDEPHTSTNGRLEYAALGTPASPTSGQQQTVAGTTVFTDRTVPAERQTAATGSPAATARPAGRGFRPSETSTPERAESSNVSTDPVAAQPRLAGSASRPRQPRGSRRAPAVAITIATTDTEPTQWKIEARVGARVALRSGSVAPARVWELVRLLENDALTKAVSSILDDQRKAAQARADVLTAELAQVRAELDALPD